MADYSYWYFLVLMLSKDLTLRGEGGGIGVEEGAL